MRMARGTYNQQDPATSPAGNGTLCCAHQRNGFPEIICKKGRDSYGDEQRDERRMENIKAHKLIRRERIPEEDAELSEQIGQQSAEYY